MMPKQTSIVKAIQCSNCGSSLNLFGGHNVKTVKCSSCHACIDLEKDFKVILQFRDNKRRPNLPLKLGMQGKIHGVDFIVIGIIQSTESGSCQSFEFQLFSPTHGYAWLCREELHYTFIREVKDLPDPLKIPNRKGATFKARGKTFTVFESGTTTVKYVEGELTYIAKVGDKTKYTVAANAPYMYEVSTTNGEKSYSFGEYITPEDIYKAFKISGKPRQPQTVYFCQPYEENKVVKAMSSAIWFAIISLIITFYIFVKGSGTPILQTTINHGDYIEGLATKSFTNDKPNALMLLDVRSQVNNSWVFCNITVEKDNVQYFSMPHEISYYYGGSGEDAWKEGSRSCKVYFKLPETGEYTLYVQGESAAHTKHALKITIKKDIILLRYFIIATVLLGIIALIPIATKGTFLMKQKGVELGDL